MSLPRASGFLPVLLLILGASFSILVPANAWGAETHTWVALHSVQYLSQSWAEVWSQYQSNLTQGAVAPDQVFRDFYNHVYHPTTGYGGAPKAVEKWYGYLVGNLSVGDYEVAVFSAGVLSHYIADVANPIHTDSSDAEDAIHSKYETDVSQHLSQITVGTPQLDSVENVTDYAGSISISSHQCYWALVGNYTQSGWNTYVENITVTYLNLAVKATASLWASAINASGASPVPVNPPADNSSSRIVVNEVEQNPPGTNEGFEWVELYNPTADEVDVGGWTVSTTHGLTVTVAIPKNTRIAGYGYLVVSCMTQWLDNEDESVILRTAGGAEIERTPLLSDTANDGRSWQRYPNGQDTNSSADWGFRTSTKGVSNGPKLSSTITCTVSSSSPTSGNNITVSGAISPARSANLTITYRRPDGSTLSRNVMSGSDGRYSDTYKPLIAGLWSVRASWEGDAQHESASSLSVSFTVSEILTSISCSVSPQELTAGNVIVVSGSVTPAVTGNVTLTYRKPDGSSVVTTVTLGLDGSYNDTYTPTIAGSWSVQASWEGDPTHAGASSSWVTFTVAKSPSTISCEASPSNITIKNSVTISGSINPPCSEVTATISYRSDAVWSSLANVTTDSEGNYSYSWTPISVGSYQLKASWEGDIAYSGASSGVVTVIVTKIPTVIYCSVSPSEVTEGNSVTVSGFISPAVSGRTVTLTYRRPDGAAFTRSVTTSSDGSYSDSFTPTPRGSWSVTASWAGDTECSPAESQALTLTVTKPPSSITCTVSLSSLPYGESVKVTGQIIPAVANATVGLGFVRPGWLLGSYSLTEVVKTDANGTYSHEYAPDQVGSWSVTASWSGNDQYLGATSETALSLLLRFILPIGPIQPLFQGCRRGTHSCWRERS